MWKPFWAVVKKELASVAKDRTILIAILIQLFMASFSSALLIGLLSLYDPESISEYRQINVPVALVDPTSGPLEGYLSERGLRVHIYDTLDQAATAYARGQVRAILAIPEPSQEKDAGDSPTQQMRLFLPRAQAQSSLIQMILQDPLRQYENYLRQQNGLEVRYTDLEGKAPTTYEFIYSAIIPILMFFPAFVAGSMVVDSISEEVENKTLETLLAAPLTMNIAAGGKIAAAVLLAIAQCTAWLGVLRLNDIIVQNALLVLLLAASVAGIIAVGAAFIAVIFKDRERSQFVYSLFVLAVTSLSYLLDISPLKTISRLASGDYYTHAGQVLVFCAFLAALAWLFFRRTRKYSI